MAIITKKNSGKGCFDPADWLNVKLSETHFTTCSNKSQVTQTCHDLFRRH